MQIIPTLALAEDVFDLIRSTLEVMWTTLQRRVVPPITWADLLTAGILLLATFLIATAVRAWMNRVKREVGEEDARPHWLAHLVTALSSPSYAVLWVVGIYFAIGPIVFKWKGEEDWASTRASLQEVANFALFLIVVWAFYRVTDVLNTRLLVWAKKSESKVDDLLVPMIIRTLRVTVPLIAIILALPLLGLPASYDAVLGKITSLALIGIAAWILFQLVRFGESMVLSRYDVTASDNLSARKVHTQVKVLSRTVYFIITIFTLASMLMVFEEVRRFGGNILASAGVVGIIMGFAAQRTIANLFAGFQIAMAQPIRMDDVVIVEGEWGRVEEITLTYVVIKIWDQRRLVVPLSHFIEKPFQNWTRVSSEIMGSIFLYTDYTVPLEELRKETQRLVENHPDWDRKFWNLQVTDTTDRSVQVRVLATSSDSGKAWNLRCDVREGLIKYLQAKHPNSLPRVRAELFQAEGGESKGGLIQTPPPTG